MTVAGQQHLYVYACKMAGYPRGFEPWERSHLMAEKLPSDWLRIGWQRVVIWLQLLIQERVFLIPNKWNKNQERE